ncbi:MAG: hypothetical protein AAF518_13825 [Spirochaetota bacterium]
MRKIILFCFVMGFAFASCSSTETKEIDAPVQDGVKKTVAEEANAKDKSEEKKPSVKN